MHVKVHFLIVKKSVSEEGPISSSLLKQFLTQSAELRDVWSEGRSCTRLALREAPERIEGFAFLIFLMSINLFGLASSKTIC